VEAIPKPAAVGTAMAVDSTAGAALALAPTTAVPTRAANPTPVVADIALGEMVDSTAAVQPMVVPAATIPAVFLVAGCQPDPRRGAVARPKQLPLSAIRQVLLHPGNQELAALPLTTANGTRLAPTGIHLQRHREDHRLPSATANGTRLQTAGILLPLQRAAHQTRGWEAQREPGMAKATRCPPISLDRPCSHGALRPVGRQAAD
jgi:hypothetical protein